MRVPGGILTLIIFPIIAFKALPSPFSQIVFFSFLRAVPTSQAPWLLANSYPSRSILNAPSRSLSHTLPCPSSNTFGAAPQKCLQTVRTLKLVKEKHIYWHLLLPGTVFCVCVCLFFNLSTGFSVSPHLKAGAMFDGICKAPPPAPHWVPSSE